MNSENNPQGDLLNTIGQAILKVDTRWVIIGAVLIVGIFSLVLWKRKNRWVSREDAVGLGLTLPQLYSAPVLFSMLVLIQPPAVDLVGNFQRQSAGLLAFIFLIAGVIVQVKKVWTTP